MVHWSPDNAFNSHLPPCSICIHAICQNQSPEPSGRSRWRRNDQVKTLRPSMCCLISLLQCSDIHRAQQLQCFTQGNLGRNQEEREQSEMPACCSWQAGQYTCLQQRHMSVPMRSFKPACQCSCRMQPACSCLTLRCAAGITCPACSAANSPVPGLGHQVFRPGLAQQGCH